MRLAAAVWLNKVWLVLAVMLLCCVHTGAPARAQVAYPPVVPGYRVELPRDEGSHPQYRTEWWYLTGWLQTEAGAKFGFQVTFFRTRPGTDEGNPSRFTPRQLLFAHAAISDPRRGSLLRAERSARAGFGLAEALEGTLDVSIDRWRLRKVGQQYRAEIAAEDFVIELQSVPTQPPLLQGEQGFSQKGPRPTSASYYYSLPQLSSIGRVVLHGKEHLVRGLAWFDHEWSSELLDPKAQGWDWVGLNFYDGGALMALRIRDRAQRQYWAGATVRDAGALAAQSFPPDQVRWEPLRHWRSPRSAVRYPVQWQVTIGRRRIWLQPLMDDQENDARASTGTLYWEGAVRALDEAGRPIGVGYLELTGYGAPVKL